MPDPLLRQEKFSIVSRFPLFADLPLKDRREIARASMLAEHRKGEVLYRQGDEPDAFYCVVTGRLKACITRNGAEEDLEYLKRGKYFGIISILTGEPHSVTIRAVNDSVILKIPKPEFEKILKRMPQVAMHLGLTLSRRLKSKDAGGKRIFESTIISVYGIPDSESEAYASDLGAALASETHKKVINILVGDSDEGLSLGSPFFDGSLIEKNIAGEPSGGQRLRVSRRGRSPARIASLLSYLTNDYHYVIAGLSGAADEALIDTLRQADMVHLVVRSDERCLKQAADIIGRLKGLYRDADAKIKAITSEHGVMEKMGFERKKEILKHAIFAALPDRDSTVGSEYLRAVRRIAREVGECLVGLALGSGAAQGLAHIGVLKVIEREEIPIDIVVGTSMGAVIGALWAHGRSAAEMEEIMGFFKRKIQTLRMIDLAVPRKGILKGREVKRFLLSQFGRTTFHDLRLPFKAVCCDIEKREEVIVSDGSLADAVMASVAIPGAFEPVTINGRMLVDGGIINPVATNCLIRGGVSKIIAVNTLPAPEDIQQSKKKVTNILDIIVNTLQASEYLLAEVSCQDADIAMHPILPTVDWYEFYEGQRVIERGVEEALKFLPQLKELAAA